MFGFTRRQAFFKWRPLVQQMQILLLIGPNSLGLTHVPTPKPVTEARGMCCSAWPGLGQCSSLKLGWGNLLHRSVVIETGGLRPVCGLYVRVCTHTQWVVWGAWTLVSQNNSPLSPSVELHTYPWDWTPVGHGYLPTLDLSVTSAVPQRWGPPFLLEVFPRLCLACLQLVLFLL